MEAERGLPSLAIHSAKIVFGVSRHCNTRLYTIVVVVHAMQMCRQHHTHGYVLTGGYPLPSQIAWGFHHSSNAVMHHGIQAGNGNCHEYHPRSSPGTYLCKHNEDALTLAVYISLYACYSTQTFHVFNCVIIYL